MNISIPVACGTIAVVAILGIAVAPSQNTRVEEYKSLADSKNEHYSVVSTEQFVHYDIEACRNHWEKFLDLSPIIKYAYNWKTLRHYHDVENNRSTVTVGFKVDSTPFRGTCWLAGADVFESNIGSGI